MLRRLLLAAVTVMVVPLAAMLAPGGTASAATPAACTSTSGVSVSSFAFNPPAVPPGGSSPLTLVLQNCSTSQAAQGSTAWFGQYTGQGCPVIDPIPFSFTIAPGGSFTQTNTYGDPGFSGCHPSALKITVNVNVDVNGTAVTTTASATLTFTCTNGVAIDQFSFNPGTVFAGQTSQLTLVLRNCTNQAITGGTIWAGQFTGAGSTPPPGCPALDPTGLGYSLAPGGTATLTMAFGDLVPGCQASGMKVTMNSSVNVTSTLGVGGPTATANLAIIPPVTGACHVTYTPNNWQGGFTANITIANNGATAINGWTLTFTFPGDQKITNPWNASVTQSGENVTATNLGYNSTIAPGGSQSFGFQGTWTASDASPTSFSVNGSLCT
jgi:cellulase/cellobiase CelA1